MNSFDIVVIGSGLGGSACAVVLSTLGYRVALIEKGSHPRFAIGESATPVTSKKIRHLGEAFGIPEFDRFSTYDKIKESNLGIHCGPKELFHYYVHKEGQKSVAHNGEIPEFIVQTPEVDAQYFRSDSDEYMVEIAKQYGVTYLDNTSVEHIEFSSEGASISCISQNKQREIDTQFVIDGTGFRSIIGQKYDLKVQGNDLNIPLKSRSIFSHFKGVGDFEKKLQASDAFVDRSPAPRARATQHHCFDGGWVWVIPFENGVTSVGLNLDIDKYPMNDIDAEEEFWSILERYPIIMDLMRKAESVRPFIKTGRMQYYNREMVGDRWAMLPASAYGLDAWFSTGLASSFIAIHRLADILHTRVFPGKRFSRQHLLDYELAMKKEYLHVTKMVHGMYKSFKHYDVFKHYCSLCFMGAESYLASGGIKKGMDSDTLLLNAGDPDFVDKFGVIYDRVMDWSDQDKVVDNDINMLNLYIREDMAPYNFREFGDPKMHSMHPRVVIC